jgi:alkylhydroperoxidase family enzyme
MVAEVRRARDADTFAPWESPSTVDGLISDGHALPDAVVDLVWRLTNHPGSLTSEWHDSILGRGVQALAYVEVVSIVAQVNCVDRFADALELDRVSMPEAQPGEPDGQVPDDAAVRLHWVPTADVGGANVWRALSGVPAEQEARSRLSTPHYLEGRAVFGDVVSDRFSLQRVQMELIAARTSKLNECFY